VGSAHPTFYISSSLLLSRSPEHPRVEAQINTQDQEAQEYLQVSRQGGGVKEGKKIVLHEGGAVREGAALQPQPVLQRGEGADPAGKFDEGSPQEGRRVHPGQAPPLQDQKPSQNHEKNKSQVDY
jgi:hypothetical protein